MFFLRFASFCLLLVVAIDLSSGRNYNSKVMRNSLKFSSRRNITRVVNYIASNLTFEEDTFKELLILQFFYLYDIPTLVIPKNMFKYSKDLKELAINNCRLTALHPDIFAPLESLYKLHLNLNYLTEIDEGLLRHNTNLTVVTLSHNRLTVIHPNTFATLVHLKYIALNGNRMTSLPKNLFAHNPQLMLINLSSNRIKVLPVNIFRNNVNLMNLYLHNNHLSSFDMDLLLASPLMESLYLHNNELTEISSYDKVHQFWPKLQNISLTGNDFNCSYYRSVFDYCTDKGIYMTISNDPYYVKVDTITLTHSAYKEDLRKYVPSFN